MKASIVTQASGPVYPSFLQNQIQVLTKAYDALPALRDVAPRLSPESVVVLLPNGMGHYEEIKVLP